MRIILVSALAAEEAALRTVLRKLLNFHGSIETLDSRVYVLFRWEGLGQHSHFL